MCKLLVYTINICSNISHCFREDLKQPCPTLLVQKKQELYTFGRISLANAKCVWKDTTLQPDEDVSLRMPVTAPVSEPTMICTRRDTECELNYKCHVVNKTFSSQFTSDCHIYYHHNCHTSLHLVTQPGPDLRSSANCSVSPHSFHHILYCHNLHNRIIKTFSFHFFFL